MSRFVLKGKNFEIDLAAIIEIALWASIAVFAWNAGQQAALEYHRALEEKCPCLLPNYEKTPKGYLITEEKAKEREPDLVSFLSAKIYYRSGGKYWINPYTLEIEPTRR